MMYDCMVDLETLGKGPYCIVLSIAAVLFDRETGELGAEFSERISVWSCRKKNMYASKSTVEWWRKQDQRAFDLAFSGREDIEDVLMRFRTWIKGTGIPYRQLCVWGNSARFDFGILSAAYSRCKIALPFNTFNEIDFRTVIKFAPHIRETIPFEGIKHDPVADCKHQIKAAVVVWNLCNRVQKPLSAHPEIGQHAALLSPEYTEKLYAPDKG